MAAVLLETLTLKAAHGLRFLDACSGQPVLDGLCCTLRRKRDLAVLAREALSPSGVHHWPALGVPWIAADAASPPSPPVPARAEVLVTDLFGRFLPLRLDWPPAPGLADGAIASCTLMSAPQRLSPPGAVGIVGLLRIGDGQPAAWARLLVTDGMGRMTEGASDGAGRFALHLPCPRPERKPPASPPSPLEAPAPPGAVVALRVFHDPAVAQEAAALAPRRSDASPAPLLSRWRSQTEVRALAHIATADALGPLRVEPGRPAVPRTEGLPPNCSELRLAPL